MGEERRCDDEGESAVGPRHDELLSKDLPVRIVVRAPNVKSPEAKPIRGETEFLLAPLYVFCGDIEAVVASTGSEQARERPGHAPEPAAYVEHAIVWMQPGRGHGQ